MTKFNIADIDELTFATDQLAHLMDGYVKVSQEDMLELLYVYKKYLQLKKLKNGI